MRKHIIKYAFTIVIVVIVFFCYAINFKQCEQTNERNNRATKSLSHLKIDLIEWRKRYSIGRRNGMGEREKMKKSEWINKKQERNEEKKIIGKWAEMKMRTYEKKDNATTTMMLIILKGTETTSYDTISQNAYYIHYTLYCFIDSWTYSKHVSLT